MSVADVDRQLICLLDPARCHGPPRCIYVGYGRYSFVDIAPRARAYLGVASISSRDNIFMKHLYKYKNKI